MSYGCINCVNCQYDEEDNIYFCAKEKELDNNTFNEVWFEENTWDNPKDKLCDAYKEPSQI